MPPTKPDPARPASTARTGRRPYAITSGVLLAAAPIPWAVACWAHGPVGLTTPIWITAVTVISTLGLLGAGFALPARRRYGRPLASIGAVGALVLAGPRLPQSPALTLLLAASTLLGLGMLWNVGGALITVSPRREPLASGRVRGAAFIALGLWLVVGLARGRPSPDQVAAVGVSMAIAVALGVVWIARSRRTGSVPARILAASLAITGVLAAVTLDDPWSLVGCGSIYATTALVSGPRPARGVLGPGGWWNPIFEHPERMLVGTFAMLSVLGTVVLALPHSAAGREGIGIVDAAFTAVSAVCVTGLVVRDTPVEFSALGQVGILVLIQLGGLGIMTFSTAALRVLGRRMSLRQESAVATLIGTKDRGRLIASAQDVLRLTFVAETAGAVLLTPAFVAHGDSLLGAVWRSVFTSVSAFCNAGFSLQSDSLMPYQQSPFVLHVVAALIILGGLSPVAVFAVPALLRRRPGRISAQARICLLAAMVLLAAGFVLVLAAEWDNTLAGLPLSDKLNNAWFQSATLRTAGFNSIDIAAVRPATLTMMMAFMFIGGSPGGTAGGMKTTTVTLMLLAVISTIRGRPHVEVFGRRVPDGTIRRAAVIGTVAIAALFSAVLALLLTQRISMPAVVFEVVSALGTVGLSVGATSQLDSVGKAIVLLCMFIGRIGGLTLMMLMSQRVAGTAAWRPPEDIAVG